jgi:hypothetical protein
MNEEPNSVRTSYPKRQPPNPGQVLSITGSNKKSLGPKAHEKTDQVLYLASSFLVPPTPHPKLALN